MISAGLIVIPDNDDTRAPEMLIVIVSPFTGAAWTRCCGNIQGTKGFDILLALNDSHHLLVGDGLYQSREAIGYAAHPVEVRNPPAIAVWPVLAETLWLIASYLEQEFTTLIFVSVGCNFMLRLCRSAVRLWKRIICNPEPAFHVIPA
jgi:hypothetical protein